MLITATVLQNGYLYQRWGNPTADAAADVIAQLEGAAGTMLFSSGMAAINTTLFSYLKAGDHLVRREREGNRGGGEGGRRGGGEEGREGGEGGRRGGKERRGGEEGREGEEEGRGGFFPLQAVSNISELKTAA